MLYGLVWSDTGVGVDDNRLWPVIMSDIYDDTIHALLFQSVSRD